MMSELKSDRDGVELEAGMSVEAVESDDRSRPDDSQRLEIIRLIGQLGAGDKILWDDRKQPLTVVRRISADDLRGQCLNFRRFSRQWAARAIRNDHGDMTDEEIKDRVGDLSPTREFGKEFLLVRGPRGGLYRMAVAYSDRRGRHIPIFQNRVRAKAHASGKFRSTDAWDGIGNEIHRLARVGHDGDVDPDAVDPDDSAAFVSMDELPGRSVIGYRGEDGTESHKVHTFTDADVDAGVVPSAVSEYAEGNIGNTSEEPNTGTYNVASGVTLDLSEFADTESEDIPSRYDADTYLAVERDEDGGMTVSEVSEDVHHDAISADAAYIKQIQDGDHMKAEKVTFGSSYPVFVENGGKEAVKEAPTATYDDRYQNWTVDGDDVQVALDALLDVDTVDRITAPPNLLKLLRE